jgi:hypothetical protein
MYLFSLEFSYVSVVFIFWIGFINKTDFLEFMVKSKWTFKKFCLSLYEKYLVIASTFLVLLIVLLISLTYNPKDIIILVLLLILVISMVIYLVFCGLGLIFRGDKLFRKRKLWAYVVGYLQGFLGIIVIFTTIYILLGALKLGSFTITDTNFNLTSGFKEMYFTALSFYSMGFGEMIPEGWNKLISVFNVIVGSVYSVVYIGFIFMSQTSKKKN